MKTEEEIIKALEICENRNIGCGGCPYIDDDSCFINIYLDALNLIKKQQAEIERLKTDNILLEAYGDADTAEIRELRRKLEISKSEAVKEFAERLKEMKYESIEWSHGEHPYVVEESDIDNLVEEMVGEK